MSEDKGENAEPQRKGAPIGNKFWEKRAKHGREKLLTSPEALREDCIGYFNWVEDNPLVEGRPFSYQGESWIESVPKMRAMTIEGLCLHLGIAYSTWRDYATKPDRKEFLEVITWAESVIRAQKFEGAAADLLNPNIIARDLGLVDKKDLSSTDGSLTPKSNIDTSKLSTSALAEILAAQNQSD